MELLQLTYFCYAASEESFTKAAEHFKVPQSNISRAIRMIENELGVKLFSRTANRITLNERGRVFYRYARESLDALERGRRAASESFGEPRGEIKLLLGTCRRIAMAAIKHSRELYPDITFSVRHGMSGGEFDFTVSDIPPSKKRYDRILLASERMLLAVPNALASENEKFFESAPFISLGRGTRLHALTEQYCSALGFSPNIAIQTDDPSYVRRYLEMGLGVALWPEKSWAEHLPSGVRLLDVGFPKRDNFVFWDKDSEMSRTKKAFLDILIEEFQKI